MSKNTNKSNKGKKVIAGIACIVVIGGVGFFVGANSNKIFTKQKNNNQTELNSSNTENSNITQSNNEKNEQVQQNENENNSSNKEENNEKTYSQKELEQMALDFYEEKTGYRPGSVASEIQKDGTVAIQLYDSFSTHNSTSDWYTVNQNNAQGTDVSGNKIDLKNKTYTITKDGISVKYTPQIIKKLEKGNAKYIYRNWVPEISGVSENIATAIEKNIINSYTETYNETSEDAEDDYVMEILEGASESEYYSIGFNVIAEPEYINNKIITFKYKFTGGLGGVGWDANSGFSFDIKTGKVLTMAEVITDGDKYTQIAKNSVMNQLKADERYSGLNEGYEEVVDSLVEFKGNDSAYLREDGIVLIIPKYDIGPGAAGEFEFVVKYDELGDAVNLEKF